MPKQLGGFNPGKVFIIISGTDEFIVGQFLFTFSDAAFNDVMVQMFDGGIELLEGFFSVQGILWIEITGNDNGLGVSFIAGMKKILDAVVKVHYC